MFQSRMSHARRGIGALTLFLLTTAALGRPVDASVQQPPPAISPPASSEAQAPPGVPVRRLSVDEAVALALENNLALQVVRIDPQIQDLTIAQAQSAWIPNFSTGVRTQAQNAPSNSFLSGAQGSKVSDDLFSTNAAVAQLLPWGGSYSVSWDNSRASTTNIFSNFNPTFRTNFAATATQPLARNFKIDSPRTQLLISRKNREISDVALRQSVVSTVRNVKNAYWNLFYANSSLAVQRQSLQLANEALRNSRARVEIGTMAPIDIVEAESEVARNEESVILAEAAIAQAEDRLRALILNPATPNFWDTKLELADSPGFQTPQIDVDAAVKTALDKRTDILRARKTLENSEINIRYFQNQTLPDVNLEANYGLAGIGGTQLVRGAGFPGPVIGEDRRSFGAALADVFRNDFPSWSVGVSIGYPIGSSGPEVNLARARLEYTQSQAQIRSLELQATAEVRDAARQVTTNLKRVEATRAARELSERRLEAEQKKFGVGMSTSFLIFQAQRDLSASRNNELRAIVDYNTSLVDFEAVQEAALSGGGITVVTSTTSAATGSAPAVSTAATSGSTAASSLQGAQTGQRR